MTTLLNQLNTNRNTYQIKNLGRVVTGKTPSKDHPEDWGNQIDFITPTDFSGNEKYLPIIKRKISQSGAIRYKNMIVPERSVVVTCIGSDMGKVIITKNKALTNQQINTIVVDQEKFDIDYVYYVLRSLYPTLRSVAEEGGSTMPIITKSTFEQLEFEAPNLTTQNKIAEILSAYDAKIENNNIIIQKLETMALAIFDQFSSQSTEGRLVDEAEIIMGQSPKSSHYNEDGKGLPFHQGVTYFGELYPQNVIYSTGGEKKARLGDILVSVRAPVGRINIANSEMIIGRGLSALRSKSGHQSYLLYLLKNLFHKEDLFGSGSIFAAINKKEFENLSINILSGEVKDKLESKLLPIDQMIQERVEENITLKKMRDVLLAKLI